ncbi:MAG: NCS2 family permease [Elusimicrobiota bacterium]|nr:NCS2 family permease [Elusimicrobiota bacterium]
MTASQPVDRRREVLAGVTTFFTMAYIVVVNPSILSAPGTGMPFSGVLTATVLLAFSMTLLMGLYGRLPFAVAPGMGLNAFFAYTVVLGHGVPWPTALGAVFWAGVLFLVLSLTPLRERVAEAIPERLRTASAAGIGLFLAFIGLKNAGFIVADPATFVKLGTLDLKVGLSLAGGLVTVWLMGRRSPFAFLAGILGVTAAAWALGLVAAPPSPVSKPDFSLLFKLDPVGALAPALLPTVVSILMTDLFDSVATFVGVAAATGLTDEAGRPKNLRQGLIVDAWATLGAGLLGTSSGTAYIESAAGIEMGGRTGLTAVAAAVCFLPCLFLAPLAGMVPPYATAPTLVIVGALMFRSVTKLDCERLEDAVPAFLATALVPLTFSITQGLLWGFVSHAALYALAGRRREVPAATWAVAVLSAALLVVEHAR